MKLLLTIAVTFALLSCGQNASSDKNDLLTSVSWTIEKGTLDGDMPKATEIYKFLKDGTYILESGEVKVDGKWSWTKDGEIYLQTEGLIINGQVNKFDANANSYLKVVELTDKTLRTMERGEHDAADSGIAIEKSYTAQSL